MKSEITIITVLYNTKIHLSKTLNTIKDIASSYDLSHFNLIIYDNSNQSQEIPSLFPLQLNYYHDKHNGGLAAAYNFVLKYCSDEQIPWLLLLDQDTLLTKEYFIELKDILPTITQNEEVVCVVPQILCDDIYISPVVLKTGGFIKKIKKNFTGLCDFPITGINSGTLLKVDYIKSLGGFNALFKLDMLDYWYFRMILKDHKKTYIMKSLLQHNLSIMDYSTVSEERYENIIKTELIFFRNYCTKNDLIVFRLRLFFRLLKQWIKVKNKKIARITFSYLFCKK